MPPNPTPETRQFNDDVQSLLKVSNPHSKTLLAFIRRRLYQFGLQAYFTEVDIFVEAYLRGVRYTYQNQVPIQYPHAWMKRTAYNVIREWKRDRQRYAAADLDALIEQGKLTDDEPFTSPTAFDGSSRGLDWDRVIQSFGQLSVCDRNLIYWRYIEGLSWQDIQARLATQGHGDVSQSTLRKRGQRAMDKLRELYGSLCDNRPS
jgi:DNA-directed RNA polymerase specialized sigma24 family protein